MYLKKITLSGFKSFASKTEVVFCDTKNEEQERFGVTAIVGPNGSGKSNIADAIRWVMGEQSAKNLRGKKTHDVIFGGSKGKGRMGSAFVSLLFDNSDRKLDIDFNDVVVTRKVHRSGEGEYFINDSKVRLLDVIDLFATIGIGKESQCVLNQGMADAVLSANPLERRAILEEAAGVKPYQIKRDRSLRKLATTRENLTQTAQLIEEIEPHLRLLKRQAKRAEQRKQVEVELKNVQLSYYRYIWGQLQKEQLQYEEVIAATGREIKQEERKLDSLLEAQEKASKKMRDTSAQDKIRMEIAGIRREISDLERKRSQWEGMVDAQKERLKHIKTYDIVPVDLPFVRKRLGAFRERLREVLSRLRESVDASTWKERVEKALELVEELRVLDEECKQSTVKVDRGNDRIEKERALHEKEIARGEGEIARISENITKYENRVQEKERESEALAGEIKSVNESYFAMEREISKQRSQLEQLRARHNEQKIAITRCEVHIEDTTKEIEIEMGLMPEQLGNGDEREEGISREDTQYQIARLKSKLAMIGGIDPLVSQEYKETQERYDFLTKESEDLANAIISLEKLIVEMNTRIEKDFSSAFAHINTEFGRYFKTIFDGGEACLEKVKMESKTSEALPEASEEEVEEREEQQEEDEKRPLSQWGVEMRVKPPKKKIDRLSMLSGGERSLVSLALLFAIISHNPPPFVVLDEVEAALDEHNSQRFAELLRTLSESSQFIIITHNRETMRQADVLYGVTMEEGMSKLLSIRLEQGERDVREK